MLPCTLGLTVDCPDEDEIVAYAQGHLGGLARQRLAAHVDGCAVCVALVAEAVRGEVTRREDEPAIGDDPLRPALTRGRSLGRYLVLAPLGEGGLGRVVAAYDPQLDRRVAIKLLDPRAHRGLTAEQLRARLLREAQALAKLRHPNVVAVHDVGMTEDEPTLVFLAMELVEGATLREWLHQGPRSWPEIRDVFVRNQSDRDALWVDLLRKTIPETGAAEARLLVAAAVSFIEDVARTWHLTQRTGVAEEMTAIAMSILTSQAAGD